MLVWDVWATYFKYVEYWEGKGMAAQMDKERSKQHHPTRTWMGAHCFQLFGCIRVLVG